MKPLQQLFALPGVLEEMSDFRKVRGIQNPDEPHGSWKKDIDKLHEKWVEEEKFKKKLFDENGESKFDDTLEYASEVQDFITNQGENLVQNILFEKYAKDFKKNQPQTIMSITKMFVNLFVGELVKNNSINLNNNLYLY